MHSSWNNLAIALNRHGFAGKMQFHQQIRNGCGMRWMGFAIDLDVLHWRRVYRAIRQLWRTVKWPLPD